MTWPTATIDSLKADARYACVGGPFGSELTRRDYVEDGVPVIRGVNLPADTQFLDDQFVFVSEQKADELAANTAHRGDLIFTQRGTLGQVGLIPANAKYDRYIVSQSQMKLTVDEVQVRAKYLYYYFRQKHVVDLVTQRAITSGVPHINLGILKSLEVLLPPRDAQDRIIAHADGYDDLIANNRRRIELLEKSARELFKEWFVRLRYSEHEHDNVVDGVPDRWQRITVEGACSKFIDGDWLETKDQGGEGFRILQISNIGVNEFVETGNYRYITEETLRRLNCTEIVPGDILISRMPEPIGRAWLVTAQSFRMVTAVDVTIARPDEAVVEPLFLLHYLNSPAHLARCAAGATGATRPRVAKRVMGALPIVVPPKKLQLEFGELAMHSNEMKTRLIQQNASLTRARDLLLPRLMVGRLTV